MLRLIFRGDIDAPFLCPASCFYVCTDDVFRTFHIEKSFIQNVASNAITYVVKYIRVPCHDSPKDIANRFAYTSIAMVYEEPPNIRMGLQWMNHNANVIAWMKEADAAPEWIHELETWVWESLPLWLKFYFKRIILRFLKQWAAKKAECFFAPDYVWRAEGPRKGMRTVDVLQKDFEAHLAA